MAVEKTRNAVTASLGDIGINLAKVHCPRCRKQMPPLRVPVGLHEILWGGWSCPHCDCRMNKWGYGHEPDVSGPSVTL